MESIWSTPGEFSLGHDSASLERQNLVDFDFGFRRTPTLSVVVSNNRFDRHLDWLQIACVSPLALPDGAIFCFIFPLHSP